MLWWQASIEWAPSNWRRSCCSLAIRMSNWIYVLVAGIDRVYTLKLTTQLLIVPKLFLCLTEFMLWWQASIKWTPSNWRRSCCSLAIRMSNWIYVLVAGIDRVYTLKLTTQLLIVPKLLLCLTEFVLWYGTSIDQVNTIKLLTQLLIVPKPLLCLTEFVLWYVTDIDQVNTIKLLTQLLFPSRSYV